MLRFAPVLQTMENSYVLHCMYTNLQSFNLVYPLCNSVSPVLKIWHAIFPNHNLWGPKRIYILKDGAYFDFTQPERNMNNNMEWSTPSVNCNQFCSQTKHSGKVFTGNSHSILLHFTYISAVQY